MNFSYRSKVVEYSTTADYYTNESSADYFLDLLYILFIVLTLMNKIMNLKKHNANVNCLNFLSIKKAVIDIARANNAFLAVLFGSYARKTATRN